MKRYPDLWRIDDWDRPWLPWFVRVANQLPKSWLERLLPLTAEAVMASASKATGLRNFGSDDFREPLAIVLQDLNESDALTPMGHLMAHAALAMQLRGRLCVENVVASHREIHDVAVRSPIIITGLPRTGTTHLHNLLSKVRGLRFIPYWQTLSPVASPRHRTFDESVLARRKQHRADLWFIDRAVPLFKRMHEMELDLPHEELTLSALCHRSFFFESYFRAPRYRQWYEAQDNTSAYRYLRTILQAIEYEAKDVNGPAERRWILKSPQHLDQLPAIFRAFPDARIIRTHRDPARAVLSVITMISYCSRLLYSQRDRIAVARAWVDRLERMLRLSQRQAGELPAGSVMDVDFDEFMQNPERTVEKILQYAGIEYDAESRQGVRAHLQSHTRDRHGRIDYSFEDLGLNEAEVRERLSFYNA